MQSEQATMLVDVITRHCRYSGSVAHRGYRLADVLRDPSTDVLEMNQTLVSTAAGTDVRCERIFLKKNSILLAIPKGEYEAPTRRLQRYKHKDRYEAMIVLPGHILSGVVRLPGRVVPRMLLDEGNDTLPSFIGVTDVTIHGAIHGLAPSRCDVAIIRRQCIESVQLAAKPLRKPEEGDKQDAVCGKQ